MILPEFSHYPIDIHSHFNHGSPGDCPDTPIHRRDLDYLMAGYDHIGIGAVGMSTYAAVLDHTECIEEENQYLYNYVQNCTRMYQWVVIDPRQEATFLQAEQMLGHRKVLGIKLHPACHKYDIEEYGDALFSFAAAHKAVVLMHPQKIEKMPTFANRYPDMKLIIAHLASMEHVDAIRCAENGNIYTDTSGGASNMNAIVEYAVAQVGSEKILFGTDTYACAFQYGRIALSQLSREDKENILYRNAVRMFPWAFV
jgi:predicted TIM-barrel fold metal-dependent hydrolase